MRGLLAFVFLMVAAGTVFFVLVGAATVGFWLGDSDHTTHTVTVTTTVVGEDRDSDPGDQAGHPELGINPLAEATAADSSRCGSERATVKHLTDRGFTLPTTPTVMTITQLVNMAAPPVTPYSPRFPVERQLIELVHVHVIAVKQEADSDLHVIVATPTGAELNVEEPMASCDSASRYASLLAAARKAMDRAMPHPSTSSYTPVNLTATIEGVLFFDVLHGQRGAPNGVELHPVTKFTVTP